MQVLVQATDNKHLLIVLHRLRSEEFFRLLQGALLHSSNHIGLRVEVEAVADPSIVTTIDQDL